MLTFSDICATNARIARYIRKTPLLFSPHINAIAKRRVFVKAEALQHTGSFKYRGAVSAISALSPALRAKGVLAYSSGNHAQGVARAAQDFGIKATIIMPRDAPEIKIANTRAFGAEIIFYDRQGGESREEVAASFLRTHAMTLIPPFDDENVIKGQGTCGLEIIAQAAEQGIEAADILVCCGGGGLSAGIALAVSQAQADFITRPIEPEGFDDVIRSLETGQRCTNPPGGTNICDAIITPSPGELTFPILQRYAKPGIAMSETDVKCAMVVAFKYLKLVLEPGGAVALAAALYSDRLSPERDIIAVATGGNVDAALFAKILSECA